MRKIRLDIEDLAVESFHTTDGEEKRIGTVRAHDATMLQGCTSDGSRCATCDGGCPADTLTCFVGCAMTNGYQVCIDPRTGTLGN